MSLARYIVRQSIVSILFSIDYCFSSEMNNTASIKTIFKLMNISRICAFPARRVHRVRSWSRCHISKQFSLMPGWLPLLCCLQLKTKS
jgi:hypothetical protein